jgi:hypothetical protein
MKKDNKEFIINSITAIVITSGVIFVSWYFWSAFLDWIGR